MTSGGSGSCTSGGTTYFQPINLILNAYGLTLMTTGSSEIAGLAGKCMDVSGANSASGTAIQLWDCNGTGAQKFRLTSSGDLINTNSNKCVDVSNGNPACATGKVDGGIPG